MPKRDNQRRLSARDSACFALAGSQGIGQLLVEEFVQGEEADGLLLLWQVFLAQNAFDSHERRGIAALADAHKERGQDAQRDRQAQMKGRALAGPAVDVQRSFQALDNLAHHVHAHAAPRWWSLRGWWRCRAGASGWPPAL